MNNPSSLHSRRLFLKELSAVTGTLMLPGGHAQLEAQTADRWKEHIGLELFTVRDLLRQDYEGTVSKLAKIGYKEVEPADPYNNLQPKDYKALLDKYQLKMFSTHSGASAGPDLETQLEGQALMGIKYTEVRSGKALGGPPRGGPGGPSGERREGAIAAGRPPNAGGSGRGPRPPQSVESVKNSCADLNKYGAMVKRFGMKILVHNHAGEFDLLDDGKTTHYDLLLSETDPELVAMQLDIGWAYIAGQDVLAMFKKNPGRYELWHVKDVKYKDLDPKLTPGQRQRVGKIVVLGEGEVDFKTIFANASLAGLKHFAIEQDTAGQDGRDAIDDCRIAYENLSKILS